MSFSEWREQKIGDLCTVKGGKRLPKGRNLTTNKTNHPYIRIRDMYQHKYIEENGELEYVDDQTFELIKRYIVDSGDIILAIVGNTIGLVSLIGKSLNKASLTENCVKLIDLKSVKPEFIYYYLITKSGQNEIKSKIVGTSQPKLPIYGVQDIKIPVPPLNEQDGIVSTLSSLDDKIEVNNQINKTLENMAQAIFKQWFVDFEFPNEDGEPYKSSGGEMVESELGMIPKGWEVVQFRDLFKFIKGKKPKIIEECKFENSEKYLTIDVLNRNSVLFCSKEKVVEADSEDVLMVMDGASSGALYFGQKGVVASTLAKLELISKKISKKFLFYALKYFENDIKTHTTGSAIPHTDKEYAYRLMIALPNDISLQKKIDDLLSDISDTFIAREQENAILKAARDSLLPKLMSGEIRVPLDEQGDAS
ncbi:restriction endonuclease subunit S [Jeotgalibaca sp. MA1X17-3]|uniref:restriction endonuclease subunit S n=1 Tax=Jeotgalibaca sp. MA1X17-3 TaxID=2908211 RepID=UPI001F2F47C8|nr:restriction endonuclease subunit S [Jeotgalibaca sp. MA1X17-3]UJF16264.1 restriction endonuclease subunit S [Jeotgalibaca sp. MA1X17-3]